MLAVYIIIYIAAQYVISVYDVNKGQPMRSTIVNIDEQIRNIVYM